jgi:hypothetical protein
MSGLNKVQVFRVSCLTSSLVQGVAGGEGMPCLEVGYSKYRRGSKKSKAILKGGEKI